MKRAFMQMGVGLLLLMAFPLKAAEPTPWPQTALDGQSVGVGAGGKPVYLYFFAHWCETYLRGTDTEAAERCAVATRTMQTFEARYGTAITIIGIASPMSASAEGARAFAVRHDVRYPIVFDALGDLFAAYRVGNFPTSIILGPDGREWARTIGTLDEAALLEGGKPASR